MEWNEFCIKFEKIIGKLNERFSFRYDDKQITYIVASQEKTYTLEQYNALKKEAEKYSFDSFSISNENNFEAIILPEGDSKRHFFEERLTELEVTDNNSSVTYSFKNTSDEFLWHIIKNFDNINTFFRSNYIMLVTERRIERHGNIDFFDFLRFLLRQPLSLLIVSEKNQNIDSYQKYAKSFIFNFAYNFDVVFKFVSKTDELFPKMSLLSNGRINNINEIMAPQLLYKDDLVVHYYMAVASSDQFVKFIGFYHIMEHFYDDVYSEDILNSVQLLIQNPGFSCKRKKDILKIVDVVSKKIKQNKEEFQGNELEALELTLKKFINIPDLITSLDEYDKNLIDYYKNHFVSFSKGDTIDLRDINNDKLHKKLAARIYKTRNSLVHSKSNEYKIKERGIFDPFKDNDALASEIPLMRYIAEQIIINSATTL